MKIRKAGLNAVPERIIMGCNGIEWVNGRNLPAENPQIISLLSIVASTEILFQPHITAYKEVTTSHFPDLQF